jgi:hypothetical protein
LSTHPQQGHQISRAMDAVSLEQFVQGHTPHSIRHATALPSLTNNIR